MNLYAYVGSNPVNVRDALGLRIDWGNIVLTNPHVIANVQRVHQAIIDNGVPDSKFVITVTGGDRYHHAKGKIRSLTNYQLISKSDPDSAHLIERGARGVDFTVTGIDDKRLLDAISRTSFRPPPGTYFDKTDNHWHTLLPNREPFNSPSWSGEQPPMMGGRKDQ